MPALTELVLEVVAVDDTVLGVRSITLAAPDRSPLPSYTPGSHVVLECGESAGETRANAYSLTGESTEPATYRISVLRVPDGQGGSVWVHDRLGVGDVVRTQLPRSAFPPVTRASKHLLVAGGIGITPMVSHLRAARTWGRPVQVLYAHRAGAVPHLDEVDRLAGGPVETFTERRRFTERLRDALVAQPVGTHLYVCGPPGMIDDVMALAASLGWPDSRVHVERFSVGALDPGEPFRVELGLTGGSLEVPSGTSLLAALEDAGLDVPNLCRQGVCGECRIPVSGGTPLHRDLYLSDAEKQAGDALMCCVSRAAGPTLEVPL